MLAEDKISEKYNIQLASLIKYTLILSDKVTMHIIDHYIIF